MMFSWIALLIIGIVFLAVSRMVSWPSRVVPQVLQLIGVICLVIGAVFFVFWIVEYAGTGDDLHPTHTTTTVR